MFNPLIASVSLIKEPVNWFADMRETLAINKLTLSNY